MSSDRSDIIPKSGLVARGISPFVAKSLQTYPIPSGSQILDIPCGYGRHSKWMADLGHRVVAADIAVDRILSFTSLADAGPANECYGAVLDANERLPFPERSFDCVLTIDFVCLPLLAGIVAYLKPNGLFIYQTMSGRGGNWLELPALGCTLEVLSRDFLILEHRTNSVGPTKTEAETVAGRRRP